MTTKDSLLVLAASCFLFGQNAAAQGISLNLGSASVSAGGPVSLDLTISSSSGSEPASLQWTFQFPATALINVNVSAGPAATAAQKSLTCMPNTGSILCLLSGFNNTQISNGVVAVLTATASATGTINVSNTVAATQSGSSIPISGGSGTVTVINPVVLTGVACNPPTLGSGEQTSCSLSLSGGALSATPVALASSSAQLPVPASVTVPAGDSSATFTATAGTVSTLETAVVSATLSGTSVTANVQLNPPALPVITAFTATPDSIYVGETSTLNWAVAGATSLSINQGVGSVMGASSMTLSPTTTTTYTLTATNAGGSVTRTATVSVAPLPTLTGVSCNPASLGSGEPTSCGVSLSGAAPWDTIVGLASSSALLPVPASLTVAAGASGAAFAATAGMVSAAETAVVTATLSGTSVTANVQLNLPAAPAITSFTATPSSINSGQSSTLNWAVTGATSLSIDQGVGSVTGLTSKTVSPTTTTTYTLTATNAGGSVTRTATVTVIPPPTLTGVTCNPSTVVSGGQTSCSVTLSGAASSATTVGLASNSPRLPVPASVTVASGASSAAFTATAGSVSAAETAVVTATLSGISVTANVQLNPPAAPVITSFTATPSSINSGQSSTLNWAVTGATSLSIDQGVGSVTGLTSKTVSPTTTTTYTLTATNAGGSVTRTATVSVTVPAPTLSSLTCSPGTVVSGGQSSCSVSMNGAVTSPTSVTLTNTNINVAIPGSVMLAAGATSAAFMASTGAVAAFETDTITANCNGSSRSTTLQLMPSTGDPSLAGYWKMDDGAGNSAVDSSGNSNNGTFVNTPVWTTGRVGGALEFDGSDYVRVQHSASLDIRGSAISFGAWYYHTGASDGFLLGKTVSDFTYMLSVDKGSQQFVAHIKTGGTQRILRWPASVGGGLSQYNNSWVHLFITYDGSQMVGFVNGIQRASMAATGTVNGTADPFAIGARGGDGSWTRFTGKIDEVRVYSRALGAHEVSALYTGGGAPPPQLPVISSFTAQPASINSGQASTLSWVVSGATGLSINQGVGTVTGLTSKTVTPAVTTTYTLTAQNSAGSVNATATVTVNPPVTSITVSSLTCVNTTLGEGEATSCAVSISMPAPAGGVVISLTRSNTALQAPGSVNVAASSLSATFTASAGSVTANQPASLTASMNGSSRSVDFMILAPPVTPTDGLAGYWKLDEGAGAVVGDSTPNGNNGTMVGNASWTTGRFGRALDFNGSSWVRMPHSASLDIRGATISFGAWYYHTGSVDGFLLGKTVSDYTYMLSVDKDSQQFVAHLKVGGVVRIMRWPASAAGRLSQYNNTWVHLFVTYDGSRMVGYVNGLQQTTMAASGTIHSTTDMFAIGARGGDGSWTRFKGKIDEVRVYNRTLTAQEVFGLYNPASTSSVSSSELPTEVSRLGRDATRGVPDEWRLVENSKQVSRYDVYELTASRGGNDATGNQLMDIETIFTAPSGATYKVGGFRLDDAGWKVRFAPVEAGIWSWELTARHEAGSYKYAGGFAVTEGSNSGFLRLDPNSATEIIAEARQTVFHPIASHGCAADWTGPSDAPDGKLDWMMDRHPQPVDSDAYFRAFVLKGFNLFRHSAILCLAPQATAGPDERGKLLDELAGKLHQYGIKFVMTVGAPDLGELLAREEPGRQALLNHYKYLIDRYAAYVDVWELTGVPQDSEDIVMEFIRGYDPYRHPVSKPEPTGSGGSIRDTTLARGGDLR